MTTIDNTIPVQPEPKKRKRVALWTLITWTALCAIWLIAGGASNNCAGQKGDQYLSAHDAQTACQAGTGIGMALIVIVWAFVLFCIMAFTVIVRLSRR